VVCDDDDDDVGLAGGFFAFELLLRLRRAPTTVAVVCDDDDDDVGCFAFELPLLL
jgi:hypothetical protein